MSNPMEGLTDAYNAAVLEYDVPHFGLSPDQVAALDRMDAEFMGPTPYVYVEQHVGTAALLALGDDTVLKRVSSLR